MLDLSDTRIMGILNITPDSFSDGGRLYRSGSADIDAVLRLSEQMVAEGAEILDVGGESTRPGAALISLQQEQDRILPVVQALKSSLDIPVSVDTSTPEVMSQAVSAGASMINDVRALRKPGALETAAQLDVPVCLMHMLGEPASMQHDPVYRQVEDDVVAFLRERINACLEAGIKPDNIIIDPGFGFGKQLDHNLTLFRALPNFVDMGFPVLVGVSRKSMLGAILDRPVDQRLVGSVAMAMLAAQAGVKIVRVHDVGATADALKIMRAIVEER